jgi:adenylate cyclase
MHAQTPGTTTPASNLKLRLGGFIGWPTSRKLLLLGTVGVGATTLAALVNSITFSLVDVTSMNLQLLNRYLVVWIAAQVLVTAAAIPAARAGREGKWPAALFVAVQSPFIVGLLHLYGTMATPLVAIYPAIVILWTLVLDEWIGLFGFYNLAGWMITVGVLETTHRIAYAPVLLERSIDAQNDPVWFTTVSFHILVLLGFCTFLCVLFQRTRRGQEARLLEAHQALERFNRMIRRYVPAQLVEQIVAGAYTETTRPDRRKLSIVFTGVESFTIAAEALEAEDLATALSEFLSEMVAIADRHGGSVNQISGDGLMIFFGAPQFTSDADHALRAVHMSQEMQQRACAMSGMWSRFGLDLPFRIRIGINTGYASVGDFGSEGRKLYTGIGLQTHIAKRIQADCLPGHVLLSQATWALVREQVPCGEEFEIGINGDGHAVRVFAVLRDGPPAAPVAVRDAAVTAPARPGPAVWHFGNAAFDENCLELSVAGEPVAVERKSVEMLRYLLRRAGEVVTKDELLAAIWPGRVLSETAISKCVSRLREVLNDDDQAIIKTVHGYGYRFVAEITTRAAVPLPAPER